MLATPCFYRREGGPQKYWQLLSAKVFARHADSQTRRDTITGTRTR